MLLEPRFYCLKTCIEIKMVISYTPLLLIPKRATGPAKPQATYAPALTSPVGQEGRAAHPEASLRERQGKQPTRHSSPPFLLQPIVGGGGGLGKPGKSILARFRHGLGMSLMYLLATYIRSKCISLQVFDDVTNNGRVTLHNNTSILTVIEYYVIEDTPLTKQCKPTQTCQSIHSAILTNTPLERGKWSSITKTFVNTQPTSQLMLSHQYFYVMKYCLQDPYLSIEQHGVHGSPLAQLHNISGDQTLKELDSIFATNVHQGTLG